MSLVEQHMNTCRHFGGMMAKTCKAGVAFDSVKDETRAGLDRFPCWKSSGACTCDKADYPTLDEAEAREEDHRKSMERYGIIRKAIVDATEGKRGVQGRIDCPCCDGKVSFTIAGVNGHIHAQCSTKGCASWME